MYPDLIRASRKAGSFFQTGNILHEDRIVVVHNHTSGEVVPSREDISVCAGMKAAGDMIGITFFDFIIAGNGKYLSFYEEGMLERNTEG